MGDAAQAKVTYDEYLALERASEVRLEYLEGEVRPVGGGALAMAGGTLEHARLTMNAGGTLRAALLGRPCTVYSSDAKIRIEASGRATYADVSVVCGKLERSPVDAEALVNPRVIVEVLSDSTEAYDRGEKFRHYRKLASLQEYVLVAQGAPLVEVWRRAGDAWQVEESGPGERVRLASLGVELAVDELYARAVEE
jgi:Uma2 family endonuclease